MHIADGHGTIRPALRHSSPDGMVTLVIAVPQKEAVSVEQLCMWASAVTEANLVLAVVSPAPTVLYYNVSVPPVPFAPSTVAPNAGL